MSEPLPLLMENSLLIAWDYLERSGELGEPQAAGKFLMETVEVMIRKGERRKLLLVNRAIAAYQQRSARVHPVQAGGD